MSTLIYAPGVRVVINTLKEGVIDVTNDIVGGTVSRSEDAVSTASINLANPNRKYDRIFTPNDSISIEMKRVKWMPVFTGYLNSVPYFSAWSREVTLTASCTLKRLQHFYWDAYAPASIKLLEDLADPQALDGGMRDRAERILTEVVGWERSKIHIGEVPSNWFSTVSELYQVEVQRQRDGLQGEYINSGIRDALMSSAGAGSVGPNFVSPGPSVIAGIAGNQATGILPNNAFGRAGGYGGAEFDVTVQRMELTGEPRFSPNDDWYCAMRLPYRLASGPPIYDSLITEPAKKWWTNRKVVVVSAESNRAVVLRVADWGPQESTGHVIGMSRLALGTLGIVENDEVRIGFAESDLPLGFYDPSNLQPRGLALIDTAGFTDSWARSGEIAADLNAAQQVRYTVPANLSSVSTSQFAWGGYNNGQIPPSQLSLLAGRPLHPIAARAMKEMQDAAKREASVTLTLSSGYRNLADQERVLAKYGSPRAARPGTSKHGWGFAADINVGESFFSAQYQWMKEHAHRFGWIHPSWARQESLGGKNPEPWHWEFWGIFSMPSSVTGLGEIRPTPVSDNGTSNGLGNSPQLFNFGLWRPQAARESAILYGPTALTNDTPVMLTLKPIINASMRKLSSAPNGDFIAWFPDYFGVYGTAGRMRIQSIELTDFTMNWSDSELKTHFFVTGATYGDPNRDLSRIGGPVPDIIRKFFALGIASIEQDGIMRSLFNLEGDSIFTRPLELLERFGPRVQHIQAPTISSPEAEFWLAVYKFQENWASQFSTSVTMTFMPELYPGMIMEVPELGFQAYVTKVNHSFDFSQGFNTTVTIIAPSAIGENGLLGLPVGGTGENLSDYEGQDY